MTTTPVPSTLTHLAGALREGNFDAVFKSLSIDERIVLVTAILHAKEGKPSKKRIAEVGRFEANVFSPAKNTTDSRPDRSTLIDFGVALAEALAGEHDAETVNDLKAAVSEKNKAIGDLRKEVRDAHNNRTDRQNMTDRYVRALFEVYRPHHVEQVRASNAQIFEESVLAEKRAGRALHAVHDSEGEEHSDDDE